MSVVANTTTPPRNLECATNTGLPGKIPNEGS